MYKLALKHHFDSSHHLIDYQGPCSRLHGHRWEVLVEIETGHLINNMIVDFKYLKKIIDELDHQNLNDLLSFNPTAENIVKYLHDQMTETLNDHSLKIKITLWESPEASISYEN